MSKPPRQQQPISEEIFNIISSDTDTSSYITYFYSLPEDERKYLVDKMLEEEFSTKELDIFEESIFKSSYL